jgi:uncharacterized membrane protein YqjE
MTTENRSRPIADILRDLLAQITSLLRNERELASAEIREKVDQATRGLVFMVGGAVLLIPALVILLAAAVAAIVQTGLEPYWAALIVGGAALIIGIGLLVGGKGSLKPSRLKPTQTIEHLRRDATLARDHMRRT